MRRGGFKSLALAVTVSAALVSAASAQPAPSGSDEVVVTAIRPAQMRDFVRQLAETGKQDQMSRWDGKVCPGVVGVQTAAAQALIDQIALRAMSIGLEAGRPGCRANVLVIVSPDAAAFTPDFVNQNKRFFSYNEDNGNALGRQALEAFANTRAPVRWWHISQTVTDRGQVLGQSDAVGGDGDFSNAQVARVTNSGRLRGGTRQEFNRVIIIVDSAGIAGRPFPAVADYIAMVSLAQIRPDADRSRLDTVLNLFDAAEAAPQGWTAWDAAYVKGLYDADRFAASARLQENAIVRRVEKERAAEQAGQPPPQ